MARESGLARVWNLINIVMVILAGLMVVFMMCAISVSVIMRYLGYSPGAWVLEISSYLMLYITFLGTGWLLHQDGHVEVDLFLANAGERTRAGFKAVTSLAGIVVGCVLLIKGGMVTWDSYERGVTVMGILNTPQVFLMLIIPVGGFCLLVEFVLRFVRFSRIAMGRRPRESGSTAESCTHDGGVI